MKKIATMIIIISAMTISCNIKKIMETDKEDVVKIYTDEYFITLLEHSNIDCVSHSGYNFSYISIREIGEIEINHDPSTPFRDDPSFIIRHPTIQFKKLNSDDQKWLVIKALDHIQKYGCPN